MPHKELHLSHMDAPEPHKAALLHHKEAPEPHKDANVPLKEACGEIGSICASRSGLCLLLSTA